MSILEARRGRFGQKCEVEEYDPSAKLIAPPGICNDHTANCNAFEGQKEI